MAKIGSMELIVILIVAMLAIGPERMPKAARMLGKAVGSFKKYMNDATSDLREASDEFREVTDEIADAQKTVRKAFKDTDDEISKTRGVAEEKLNPKKKKKKPAASETDETDEAPKPPKDETKAEAAEPQGEEETEAQPEAAAENPLTLLTYNTTSIVFPTYTLLFPLIPVVAVPSALAVSTGNKKRKKERIRKLIFLFNIFFIFLTSIHHRFVL